MEPNLAPHLDTETPPSLVLGPLTTPWIQKHHQREVKTLARSPPYPAKDRDKLEESFECSKELRLNFIQMHQLSEHTRQQGRSYNPPKHKHSAYKVKLEAKLG